MNWVRARRFGIVRVDYDSQERSVKDSGREYSRIIAARALGDNGSLEDAAALGGGSALDGTALSDATG